MQRTLNFTGRRKIPREKAPIALRTEAGGEIGFDAELALADFDFPPDSQVFIEAFFKTTTERFSWGTVGQPVVPLDRRLKRLAKPGQAHFRVKVVEPAAEGASRLLGMADNIAPAGTRGAGKRRISLLPVDVTKAEEIADEVWRLNFDHGGGPILDLNHSVASIEELVRGEAFMALAFPTIIRGVYRRIFDDGRLDPEDDPDGWHARWLRFGARWAGPFPPVEDQPGDEQEEWVEKVVKGWSRSEKALLKYRTTVEKGTK